ncbi:LuxR C-terminal-related transcriptional regulator [Aeromicrobium erythreum]|uniref:HTH luxR-type domain-containing protein n=1 Tax=Aeromicrobium erythreum TaxID=2041 RepID=A0A0U3TFD7_9ACTN|nr:LuxR C-terminal-related transcriptional regulator [Aeromicrobium erythreum]ALX04295.1 hypothetical protein AERYTH_06085 [Aeromicrobium erythreum]
MERKEQVTTVRLPRLSARLLRRERLLDRLDQLAPITIIDGPPGSGVTTLLACWAGRQRARGALVVWLDGTCAMTGQGLMALVAEALSELTGSAPSEHSNATAHEVADLATASGRPCILIVDDAPTFHDETSGLIEALTLAPQLHLAIAVRERSGLVDAADRARLETSLITGEHLAATPSELAEMARCWGHRVDETTLASLREEVGGWVLPARLVLDATPAGDPPLVLGPAVDFVRRCITAAAAPGTPQQELLNIASLLSRVDATTFDLAVREIGLPADPHWSSLVRQLTEQSLLIHRPDSETGYWVVPRTVRRCLSATGSPPRIRDFVTQRLREDPTSSLPVDLGRLALQARRSLNWKLLRDIWVSRGLELLAHHATATTRAYANIPADVTSRMPALRIATTVAGGTSTNFDSGILSRRYAEAGRNIAPRALKALHHDDIVTAVGAAIFARRRDGDIDGALDIARWYLTGAAARAEEKPALSAAVWFEVQHGRTLLIAGDLSASLAASERAIARGTGRADCRAHVRCAAGQAALASSLLAARQETARWLDFEKNCPSLTGWLGEWAGLPARIARGMTALDLLDEESFEAQAPALRSVPILSDLWPLATLALARHASLYGDPEAAVLEVYDGISLRGKQTNDVTEESYLLESCVLRLLLDAGQLTRAMTKLEATVHPRSRHATSDALLHLLSGAEHQSRAIAEVASRAPETPARERVVLLLVQAAAALRCGRVDEARRALATTHADVERLSLPSTYAAIPHQDLEALLQLDPHPPSAALRARDILGPRQTSSHALVVLTPRELEVLRKSAKHRSLSEVAKHLSVSVNTVKKQRVSLYAKMGVKDLQSAILFGRQLGLLED